MLVAVGHAVVAEDVKLNLFVWAARRGQQLLNPLLVHPQFRRNLRGVIADAVEQAVEARPIQEREFHLALA